jgi:hypothetical protein
MSYGKEREGARLAVDLHVNSHRLGVLIHEDLRCTMRYDERCCITSNGGTGLIMPFSQNLPVAATLPVNPTITTAFCPPLNSTDYRHLLGLVNGNMWEV